ncbi:hypothetical protein GCM10025778_15940 [Paeniglutamicibacter antarcticus]|uniref:Uncharacterized protein n=1 Tax=Paeniglutamicibacter antarcticus TaxID=494023 RepID=A0ABP9TKF9_9MICC
MRGDEFGEQVGGQQGDIAIGDDDGAFERRIQLVKALLHGAPGARDLVLVGDDNGRVDSQEMLNDAFALEANHGHELLGLEPLRRCKCMADH